MAVWVDKDGFLETGYDLAGFDRLGYDCNGFDRNGCDRNGFDRWGNPCMSYAEKQAEKQRVAAEKAALKKLYDEKYGNTKIYHGLPTSDDREEKNSSVWE